MIDEHDGGARIVGQEHDLGKINYGGAAAVRTARGVRPSEPWDSAEYGVSLADAQAKWDAAQTPEAREKVIAELKALAARRAGLDTTGGRVRVMVAGKAPWHGLGVNVEKAVNSKQAIELAGLAWPVCKLPMGFEWGGSVRLSKQAFAIVRGDNGAELGSVGSKYTPIQNVDGFDFLDSVIGEFGAKYESAGSLYGGKAVWMLAHLPKQAFTVNGGDAIEPYAIFVNYHDGSGAAACYPTAERVVCANTLRMAQAGRAKGLSIRHTGNVKDKIEAGKRALGMAVESFETFKGQAEQMYATPCAIGPYANRVLDLVLDVTEAQAKMGADALMASIQATEANWSLEALKTKIKRRGDILEDIITRYESKTCGVGSIRGTAWACFNAFTEHADHAKIGRQAQDKTVRESRRFESVIAGAGDQLKQTALQVALGGVS